MSKPPKLWEPYRAEELSISREKAKKLSMRRKLTPEEEFNIAREYYCNLRKNATERVFNIRNRMFYHPVTKEKTNE